MENFTAGTKWGLRYAKAACVAWGCLASGSLALAAEDVALKETQRRVELGMEAKKLVAIGDAAYEAKDHKEAYESYKKALTTIPQGPATAEFREAIKGRYADSVVAYSKLLKRAGRIEQAQKLVTDLLSGDDFAQNKKLKKVEGDVYDPIKSNPSTTAKHAANVDEVRRLLYKADGSFKLGKYDEAIATYEKVLRVDSYNQAARRGMLKATAEKRDYYRAASDTTRAKLLTDVDKLWEIEPVPDFFLGNPEVVPANSTAAPIVKDARYKLSKIIIPRFDVEGVSPEAAIARLRALAKVNDHATAEAAAKGVNIILNLGGLNNIGGAEIAKRKVTLSITDIPADKLLDQICKQVGTSWMSNEYTITVIPAGQNIEQFFTRQFTVPPNFLSTGIVARDKDDDPFSDVGFSDGAKRVNITAKEYLESYGVTFPKGASAGYIKNANMLTVRNNATNMRIIGEAIQRLKMTQNVIVKVKLRVLDITEDELNEKGYDWLAGHSGVTGNAMFLGGGTPGNGTAINPVQIPGQGQVNSNGVTSGLRSGDGAFAPNTIDARIASGQNLAQVSSDLTRAPSILQTTAYLNDSSFQVLLRGLDLSKGTSNMWSPSVIARPGERARVENVREFIYPTEYDPPELPDNIGGAQDPIITPAMPTSFESRIVGSAFEVEPTVSPDRRYISLELAPEFADFIGFVNYGSPITAIGQNPLTGLPIQQVYTNNDILMPVFEKISTTTNVTVADGSTIAIGGMMKMDVSQVNDSVPVLGKLPLVGRYFKTNGTKSLKRAVVIFVTAELVDNTGRRWRDK